MSREIFRLMFDKLPRGELLSFGCPDPLFEAEGLPVSKYAAAIRETHGYKGEPPDVVALFKNHGWNITALDVAKLRGVERVHDLNLPLPTDLEGCFDAVIDFGTGEHVFNIGQIFLSAYKALKIGGAAMHDHPVVMGNHGFWCAQPTAMLDFYQQNGCDAEAWLVERSGLRPIGTKRFGALADKTNTVGIAFKRSNAAPRWPMQSRFLGT